MSAPTDPSGFLSRLAPGDEDYRKRSWAQVGTGFARYTSTPPLVEAALDVLAEWGREPLETRDRIWINAIHGPFRVLKDATSSGEFDDSLIAVRVLALFDSMNIWVAGLAIRYFEWFPRFKDLCLPRLVEVASFDARCPPSVPFSLRGIAFQVLSDLFPELARLPAVQNARTECITGHFGMALEISHQPASREVYERYCLVANRLMWL